MASPTSNAIKLGSGTNPVRLSFARLFNAKPFAPGQTPRFEASFLLDPSNKEHAATIATIKEEAKKLVIGAGLNPKDFKLCFGPGEQKSYDGYEGMFFVTSANTTRPTVVDRNRNPVAESDAQAPYSGSYVIGSVTLWLQNNAYGKRINANLRAVQFVKDGPAFGVAPVKADEEFEALGDGAPAAGGDDGFG
jgi:Protein of unknown function (DUF2815)